jgi:lysophospholipase L1-like esterase
MAEVAVRIFIPQETKRLAIYDKELGWRGEPNGSGRYIRFEDSIDVPFEYNELGFRDHAVVPREQVSKRIMLLGDSFVENLELPFEKTFPSLLEGHLQSSIDKRLDVVSVCSQGYSTAQEVLALRKFGADIKPDIVLLVFYTGNDYEDNLRRSFAYLDSAGSLVFPPNTDSWLKVQSASLQRWLYENSYLVFFIKNYLASKAALEMKDASKAAGNESKEYEFAVTKKLILAAKEETEKQGAQFGLVLFTSRKEVEDGTLERPDFVVQVCKEFALPFIDAREFLQAHHFFKHDVHFVEKGHEIVAEKIAAFLTTEFLHKESSAP